MKKQVIHSCAVVIIILIFQSCSPKVDAIATFVDETKSACTIPPTNSLYPTYTFYPTYTVQPPSERVITKVVVKTKTPVPTPTRTSWEPTEPEHTSLPTADLSNVPPEIMDGAGKAGMEPYEVVYLFNLIQKVARDRDPYPLLEFLRFPLREIDKCPGVIIKTPEEFIRRFPSLMTESIRAKILKYKMEDIFLSWRGMALPLGEGDVIWFAAVCSDVECSKHYFLLMNFLDYIYYWEGIAENPDPASC